MSYAYKVPCQYRIDYKIKYEYLIKWIERKVEENKHLFNDSETIKVEEIPIVITTFTKPHKVLYIDINFIDSFGYTLEDLFGKDIKNIRDLEKSDGTMIVNKKKNGQLVNHRFEIFDFDQRDEIFDVDTEYNCKIGLSHMITPHILEK